MIGLICIFATLTVAAVIGFIISEKMDKKILDELLALEK